MDPLILDIEHNQADRAAAHLLAGLLKGQGQEARGEQITNRLVEITAAEEKGVREPLGDIQKVGMRWTVSSLCSVQSPEIAQAIPGIYAKVLQELPELMFVTAAGHSVFIVSGEYLPDDVVPVLSSEPAP